MTGAVGKSLKEQNLDFEVMPATCSGILECKAALLKLSKGVLKENFIEGMACDGGCVNGAGCLTHNGAKAAFKVDTHAKQAGDNITNAVENARP